VGERLPGVSEQAAVSSRCAVHPGRPAVDRCPVCDRPRCAPDAAEHGDGGCPGCRGGAAAVASAPGAGRLERLVRGTLAGLGAGLLGGVVAAQYVDAELFAYLTPFVVGVVAGAAAQAAAGGAKCGTTARLVRAAAALCGVLGVGLGFVLEGSRAAVSDGAVVPYVLAVAGTVLWTLPPKRRKAPA
jgi:hypothetical protein